MKCLILVIKFNRSVVYDPHEYHTVSYDYPFPVGLAYISAVLKKYGYDVKILNLNHCVGIIDEIIKNVLDKERFDFVITGGISIFFPDIRTCIESVRKYAPETKIILGGGLVTSQPEIIFKLLEPDFAVIGEGEYTVKEIINCIENNTDINKINGIMFRKSNKQIVFTNPRSPITDLDSLPYPDFDGFGFEEILNHTESSAINILDSPRTYPIVASRSCPYKCTFCFHPLGDKYRQRSVDNIIGEIEYAVKKYRINHFEFYDELFSYNQERVYDFCNKLKLLQKTSSLELKWSCQMRVHPFDEDMIKIMKDAGCYLFSLGLESYSPVILKSMKKGITPQQIDRALRICVKNRIAIQGNFIFGDTSETNETYLETLKYWDDNCGSVWSGVNLSFIQLYQGTELYKRAVEKRLIKDEVAFIEDRTKTNFHPLYTKNFTEDMTDKDFEIMKYHILFVSLFPRRYTQLLVNKQSVVTNEIRVICPYCNKVQIYQNYELPSNFSRRNFTCRGCGGRCVLVSKKEGFKICVLETIFKLIGFRNMAYVTHILHKNILFNHFLKWVIKKVV